MGTLRSFRRRIGHGVVKPLYWSKDFIASYVFESVLYLARCYSHDYDCGLGNGIKCCFNKIFFTIASPNKF